MRSILPPLQKEFYFTKISFILVMHVEVYIFITNISQYLATTPAYYKTSKGKVMPKQAWTGREGSRNLKVMMVVWYKVR